MAISRWWTAGLHSRHLEHLSEQNIKKPALVELTFWCVCVVVGNRKWRSKYYKVISTSEKEQVCGRGRTSWSIRGRVVAIAHRHSEQPRSASLSTDSWAKTWRMWGTLWLSEEEHSRKWEAPVQRASGRKMLRCLRNCEVAIVEAGEQGREAGTRPVLGLLF